MSKFGAVSNQPKKATKTRHSWLLWAIAGVLILAVLGAAMWFVQSQEKKVAFTPAVTGQPKASLDQVAFDYGDVQLGKTIETVFRVKNTGDRDLSILGEPRVEVVEGC